MSAPLPAQTSYEINDASQIGAVRRGATDLARAADLDSSACSNVAIIVTELSNNILKHAKRGTVLLRGPANGSTGFEAIAIDRGPGIADITRALKDGYSTGGTPGSGLGAVRRLANEFDIWSAPSGTVAFARIDVDPPPALRVGGVCMAVHGELSCGDAWSISYDDGAASLLVVDGLGHGDEAAKAADMAVEKFAAGHGLDPKSALEHIDPYLRGTRGAAAAVARIPLRDGVLQFCGIGNIGARLIGTESTRGLASGNGIVGGQFRTPRMFDYPMPEGALLVMHSDGLRSQWNLDDYPGLRFRHPALIAAVLFRDFARGRDDVTVVVVAVHAASAASRAI